ncbi:MAG: hypothetical protein JSU68_09430 [Phycisphaerales bacterium]|nr:MAG: hypothetical protein JSU68_09430 [Phycisphaerales bacterium]
MRRPTIPSAVPGEDFNSSGDSRPKTLSPQERRTIFVHMVRMELDQRPIGFVRRRQLIRFAQDLDIDKAEADLLVTQTIENFGRAGGAPGRELECLRPQCWPLWMKLSLAVGAIALLNMLLIGGLFR